MRAILRVFFAICAIAISSVQANEQEAWHQFTYETEFGEQVSLSFPSKPIQITFEGFTVFLATDSGVDYSLLIYPSQDSGLSQMQKQLQDYMASVNIDIEVGEAIEVEKTIVTDRGVYILSAEKKNNRRLQDDFERFFDSFIVRAH